jgi:hypothetical protein
MARLGSARTINKAVYEHEADLYVIGAQARSNDFVVKLRSVTQQAIRSVRLSLMVVKKKGSEPGSIDASLETPERT